jgi:biotin operon repressor
VDPAGERVELGLVVQRRFEPHARLAAHRGEDQVDARHAANLGAHDESHLRAANSYPTLRTRADAPAMTPRTKKTAAALSGALVLASGAYALGSQAGDGSAIAGSPNAARQPAGYGFGGGPGHHFRGGPRAALADAAKQLGVSEDELLAALKKLREDKRAQLDDLRDAFEKSLASELGISEAKVEAAFDERVVERKGKRELRRDGRRGDMRNAFADELAKELGISAAKVRAAVDEVHKGGRPHDLADLATRLGVTEAKLRDALQAIKPGFAGRPPKGPDRRGIRDEKLNALAKDLGVSQAKLQAALKDIRDDLKTQKDKAIDEFAADLAKELGVSKAKVDDVIDSLGHHGRRGP